MNTKLDNNLSDADRKALDQIERNFTRFELMLGAAPMIYYDFGIHPEIDQLNLELNQKRSAVFSGSVIHQIKESDQRS